jgi:hypothetical protein
VRARVPSLSSQVLSRPLLPESETTDAKLCAAALFVSN